MYACLRFFLRRMAREKAAVCKKRARFSRLLWRSRDLFARARARFGISLLSKEGAGLSRQISETSLET